VNPVNDLSASEGDTHNWVSPEAINPSCNCTYMLESTFRELPYTVNNLQDHLNQQNSDIDMLKGLIKELQLVLGDQIEQYYSTRPVESAPVEYPSSGGSVQGPIQS
jgi:hypothetical protein